MSSLTSMPPKRCINIDVAELHFQFLTLSLYLLYHFSLLLHNLVFIYFLKNNTFKRYLDKNLGFQPCLGVVRHTGGGLGGFSDMLSSADLLKADFDRMSKHC